MFVGSIKEAEEFDNLSPEESKKRLAVLVTKMDLNGKIYAIPISLSLSIDRMCISFQRNPLSFLKSD